MNPIHHQINAVKNTVRMWADLRDKKYNTKVEWLENEIWAIHKKTLKNDCFLCDIWWRSEDEKDINDDIDIKLSCKTVDGIKCPLDKEKINCKYAFNEKIDFYIKEINAQEIIDHCNEWLNTYAYNKINKKSKMKKLVKTSKKLTIANVYKDIDQNCKRAKEILMRFDDFKREGKWGHIHSFTEMNIYDTKEGHHGLIFEFIKEYPEYKDEIEQWLIDNDYVEYKDGFEPMTLTIESEMELANLWHHLNINFNTFKENYCRAMDASYPSIEMLESAASGSLWRKVNDLWKRR